MILKILSPRIHDGISSGHLPVGQTSLGFKIYTHIPQDQTGQKSAGRVSVKECAVQTVPGYSHQSTLDVGRVVKYRSDTSIMGKFSLARLIMCAKYQRLTSEDYIRLGLCVPDNCQDCVDGQGHYVKNDKMVSCFLHQTILIGAQIFLSNVKSENAIIRKPD